MPATAFFEIATATSNQLSQAEKSSLLVYLSIMTPKVLQAKSQNQSDDKQIILCTIDKQLGSLLIASEGNLSGYVVAICLCEKDLYLSLTHHYLADGCQVSLI